MSPHRKDFKRRRKSKFKYHPHHHHHHSRNDTGTKKTRLLLELELMMTMKSASDSNNRHHISFKAISPPPSTITTSSTTTNAISSCIVAQIKFVQTKLEQFHSLPISSFSAATTLTAATAAAATFTVFPLESSRMLNDKGVLTFNDKTVKVAQSSFHSPCSQSNAVVSSGNIVGSGGGTVSCEIMSRQPNEYYFKYSPNRTCSIHAFSSLCPCSHCSLWEKQGNALPQRTIPTDVVEEHQLLVKFKMDWASNLLLLRQSPHFKPDDNDAVCLTRCLSCCSCFSCYFCANDSLGFCKSCNNNPASKSRVGGGGHPYNCYSCCSSCCCGTHQHQQNQQRSSFSSSISCRSSSGGGDNDNRRAGVTITNNLSETCVTFMLSTFQAKTTTTTTTRSTTPFQTTLSTKPLAFLVSSSSHLPSLSLSNSQEKYSSKFSTSYNPSVSLPVDDTDTKKEISFPARQKSVGLSPSHFVQALLSFLTLIFRVFWNKVNMTNQLPVLINKLIIKFLPIFLPAYSPTCQRENWSTTHHSYTGSSSSCQVTATHSARSSGHPLFRASCQITRKKSDFIYIIALGLCLLSPSVTPVITSNAIYPMDAAIAGIDNLAHADRDMMEGGKQHILNSPFIIYLSIRPYNFLPEK